MRHRDRLGRLEIMLWSGLGIGVGLVAGFILSEWVGDVNRSRVSGVARRLREGSPSRLTTSATARSVAAALEAEPRLAGLGIQVLAMARGVVELARLGADPRRADHRWPDRARRPRDRERDQQPPGARRGRYPLDRRLAGHRPERMTEPLAPQYNPSAIESALYAWWEERGLFTPDAGSRGAAATPYVIMMPPPNVTAVLHMGHGLNNTVQDVLVRFERMRGRRALWLPGTDHAGIATQNVVERLLAKDGLTRFDVGPRGVRRAGLGPRPRDRRRHPRAAQGHRLLGRLDPHLLHARRRPQPRRARGLRHAVRAGPGLSRALHHQLVPPLPHRALQ